MALGVMLILLLVVRSWALLRILALLLTAFLLRHIICAMGRGVSAGGGKSSLNYLFGSGEDTNSPQPTKNPGPDSTHVPPPMPEEPLKPVETKQEGTSAVHDSKTNNYLRSEGQNCGNFITDRPSTKVHAAPGGGLSLGYLFGGDGK